MTSSSASLRPLAGAPALARVRALWPVAALVGAFALRLALVWQRATPNYFPDEYLYAALGRSLAALEAPSVRGYDASFPALLQPLLTAGAWRAGSVETAYRIVQALNAAAFTLAAVPAWLLARRLGLGGGLAAAVAALTLLVPDALYAGLVVAEPFAYPLVLGSIAAGVAALARPSRRTQLLFLFLAALATLARIQFGVVPICFVVAVIAVGLRERSLRSLVRAQRLPLALTGAAGGLLAIAAAVRGLGFYASASHPHVDVSALGVNAMAMLYAGGWVLAPGAVLGLVLALARPRSRAELGFAALTLPLAAALLLQAALWGDTDMVQERYVFYVLPLGAIGFGLWLARGLPHRRAHALGALGLLLLAARVPLSGYAQPGADDHAPFLLAVQRLEQPLSGPANAATLVAALATVLALVAAAAPWRARIAGPLFVCLALAVSAAAFAGAWDLDRTNSARVLHRYLPADRSWVDHARLGPVTLVSAYGGRPTGGEEQLFWNRSVGRVAVLPGGTPPDRLGADPVRFGTGGELLVAGRPLRGPLLVDGYAGTILLHGAAPVAAAPHYRLWRPVGTPRVVLYVPGRFFDGTIAGGGAILVWTESPGWLELHVSGPQLRVGGQAVHGAADLRLPVCSTGRSTVPFSGRVHRVVDGRPIAGRMSVPRFVPDARACSAAADA